MDTLKRSAEITARQIADAIETQDAESVLSLTSAHGIGFQQLGDQWLHYDDLVSEFSNKTRFVRFERLEESASYVVSVRPKLPTPPPQFCPVEALINDLFQHDENLATLRLLLEDCVLIGGKVNKHVL
jgi:hypothetical protein